MELLKVTKGGSLHFKLSDGRLGVTYPSGYVRVSTKYSHSRLYQINKRTKSINNYWTGYWHGRGYTKRTIYDYRRVLIPNEMDRLEYIVNWVKKNVK